MIKEIPNHPGEFVSDTGDVYSQWRHRDCGANYRRWRVDEMVLLEPYPDKDGYLCVRLFNRNARVHALVLETFVGPCPDGMVGCHDKNDKNNNCLSNLRWDTPLNNVKDSVRDGTHSTILTIEQVKEIKSTIIKRGTISELAKKYNVHIVTISDIVHGKTWKDVKGEINGIFI